MHSIHYGQGNKNQQQQKNTPKWIETSRQVSVVALLLARRHETPSFVLRDVIINISEFRRGRTNLLPPFIHTLSFEAKDKMFFFLKGRGRWFGVVLKNLTLFELTRKTNKNQAIFLKDLFNVRPKNIYTHIHIP